MSLFEIKNLNKIFYGGVDTHVLYDISFAIEKGEFVSIIGASGSGKSTLLHIMGFLLEPTSGVYKFNNQNYDKLNDEELARLRNEEVGFVFQAFNLLPRQTVRENVTLPLMYSKRSAKNWEQKVEEVVDLVGLSHRIDYETYKLSGGEKQRTAIARALINNPKVIFADEPTGNLDSKSGQVVIETLQNLHENLGHTIILITHEAETSQYADRIITLQDGKIESDQLVEKKKKIKNGQIFLK
ncbi:MAG: ABC transporter ATP-binding protein [Patescibacteria group bacterium]